MAHATRQQRGVTLIEALVSSLILSVCLLAMLSLFTFSFNLTLRHNRTSQAYNLARHTIERVRQASFKFAPEGTQVRYYDANGGNESSTNFTGAMFRVTQNITSSEYERDSGGNIVGWADGCLRTVVVTVVLLPSNEEFAKTGTYLARSGV